MDSSSDVLVSVLLPYRGMDVEEVWWYVDGVCESESE
jgi:hypothetical protein